MLLASWAGSSPAPIPPHPPSLLTPCPLNFWNSVQLYTLASDCPKPGHPADALTASRNSTDITILLLYPMIFPALSKHRVTRIAGWIRFGPWLSQENFGKCLNQAVLYPSPLGGDEGAYAQNSAPRVDGRPCITGVHLCDA